ncbi:MAG: peptide deformylase, partial [Clostridia bacterium]|nr:peptide deformylase [Clostridia bacterium]
LANLIDDMKDTLNLVDGLGLAAPQIGILKRVAIVRYEDKEYEVVNPTILKTEGSSIDDEGCLSVSDQRGLVERPDYIKVEFFDRHGNKQTVEADGYFARVFFHEIDHLDGNVFIDKAIRDKKGRVLTYDDLEEYNAKKTNKKTNKKTKNKTITR